jgi:hypothetical protein
MSDRFWSLEITANRIFRDKSRLKNIKESYVDNLTVAQIVLGFYAFFGSRMLTTAYIMAHHSTQSFFRCIQSTPAYYSSLRFIVILSSHAVYVSQVISWLQGL